MGGWRGDTTTTPTPPPPKSHTVEELRLDTEELVVSRLLGDTWPFCGDTRPGDASSAQGVPGPWKCKIKRDQNTHSPPRAPLPSAGS